MKTFAQILTFVFFVSALSAQMSVGIKSGVALNKYSLSDQLNDSWDSNSQMGYTVGATLDIPFGGRMGLETGMFWTRKGSGMETETAYTQLQDSDGNVFDVYLESTEKLNYLTIPMHLKMHFRGKTIGSYVLAGPELNFALSGNFTDNYTDSKGVSMPEVESFFEANGVETSGDIEFGSGRNDRYSSFDFGFSIGGGLYYELEVGKITLDARYYIGMSNMANTDDDDIKIKNRNLIVQVGYAFPIGGAW